VLAWETGDAELPKFGETSRIATDGVENHHPERLAQAIVAKRDCGAARERSAPQEDCRCFVPPNRPTYLRRVKAELLKPSCHWVGLDGDPLEFYDRRSDEVTLD
jgi:hypothetical protein